MPSNKPYSRAPLKRIRQLGPLKGDGYDREETGRRTRLRGTGPAHFVRELHDTLIATEMHVDVIRRKAAETKEANQPIIGYELGRVRSFVREEVLKLREAFPALKRNRTERPALGMHSTPMRWSSCFTRTIARTL